MVPQQSANEDPSSNSKRRKRKRSRKRTPVPLVKMSRKEGKRSKPSPKAASRSSGGGSDSSSSTCTGKDVDFSSTAESLKLISAYHTLNKRLEQNARDVALSKEQQEQVRESILKEQKALGGIEAYQQASMFGAQQSKFVCADWVAPLLKSHCSTARPRILDVGAIDNQYLKFGSWLDCVPIDLNAQHPTVIKADFLDYAHEYCCRHDDNDDSYTPFDAIVLSLVLNFQGDPRKRGDMLALASDPRLLQKGGLLFIALPSASMDNSRYFDLHTLTQITNTLRLEMIETKSSAKLTLITLKRISTSDERKYFYNDKDRTFDYGSKELVRTIRKQGPNRNNFSVMLKNTLKR